jgi:hypothetical protein
MCLSPKRLWRSHWNYACINLIIPMHCTCPAPFKLAQRHNFTRQHPCSPEFGVRHILHAYGMDDARWLIHWLRNERGCVTCQWVWIRQHESSTATATRIWVQRLWALDSRYTETNHHHCDAAIKFTLSFTILRLPQNISYFWLHLVYNFRYHFTIYSLVNAEPTFICALHPLT